MDFWALYLIGIASNVSNVFTVVFVMTGILSTLSGAFLCVEAKEEGWEDESVKGFFKFFKRVFPIFLVSGILTVGVPSTKHLIAITGVHYVSNNKEIKDLGNSTLEWLQQEVNEELEHKNKD